MILPASYAAVLLLTILALICLGSWANLFKLAGKWRFELFYFDFTFGVLIAGVLAAVTFGSLGADLSFTDNLMITGKRQIAYGLAAGTVFNIANMLLVAAVAVAGMSLAFPASLGLALVTGVIWNQFQRPESGRTAVYAGAALLAAAVLTVAMAWRAHAAAIQRPRWKGIVLSVVGGLLMGGVTPLLNLSKAGEIGLGPYTLGFMLSLGVFFSTFVFNLYFVNLPVEGAPIGLVDYFRGTWRQHGLGVGSGMLWCAGTVAGYVATSAPANVQVAPETSYAIVQSAAILSALWGLLVWKEFGGAAGRVRLLLGATLALYAGGLGLLSFALRYGS